MPTYSFDTEGGKRVELFYTMDESPRIGEVIEVAGAKLTRVLDNVQIDCRKEIRFTSNGLPRNHPDAPAVNHQGKPVFSSKKQLDEFISKQNGTWLWD